MEENLTQEESLIKRIVICGPESTGKTTMINNLAVYFQTNYVDEFARDFLQKKWDSKKEICSKEDLIQIAKGQIIAENTKIKNSNKLINLKPQIKVALLALYLHF